ncbi:MAG: hypothetical protein KJO33_02905 [Gammaproteobacteria bacterium]|nr:hypothetical protein [Gammaproteobacteria bacterium]
MDHSKNIKRSDFRGAAHYRIVVEGVLDERWSDRMAGLSIERDKTKGDKPRTILSGKIRDQAELSGVLDSLYGLHLTIVRLEKVEQEEPNSL